MKKTSKPCFITDPKQLAELSSPVKQLIVNAFTNAAEPCSIKEIADRINRAPDSLYYHFRSLTKSGLISVAGSRQESGKPVTLYLPVSKTMKIKYNLKDAKFKKIIGRIFGSALRLASRDFLQGIELDQARSETATRNLYMCRMEAWLTKKDLARVNRCMEEIVAIMAQNSSSQPGERCSVFMSISPQKIRS